MSDNQYKNRQDQQQRQGGTSQDKQGGQNQGGQNQGGRSGGQGNQNR